MAPKDYVSRGRAPKKKPAPAVKAQPVQPPWMKISGILVLLIGFAYFLWTIKDSAAPNETPILQLEPNTASKQQSDLPEKPQEKWEFMDLLTDPERTTVEVEEVVEEQSDKSYVLQCGSFRIREQAEQMRAQIAFQGLESEVKQSNGSNGIWYRVVMGPYDSRRAAEKDRHTLQRAKFNTCRIW